MNFHETILLSRSHVARLLDLGECMSAVESAFCMYAERKAIPPKVLAVRVDNGGFHIKAGVMELGQNYFVAKSNGNFPGNGSKYGLPTIQGVVLVCNADQGTVLAVMDSIELTIIRTGAATGLAAEYLSRKDSRVVTICGCGNQGRASLKALLKVRGINHVYAYDEHHAVSEKYASELSDDLGIEIEPVNDLRAATLQSDICVTCTPSKQPLLFKDYVRRGTFIAAVGADSEEKHEIDPNLIASARLVADVTEQCAAIGDLHHALEQGHVTLSHVHAELGEVMTGLKSGRENDEDIIIFDSTGTALQDVAAAAIVFEKARQRSVGQNFNFRN